jgi:hypothetical protein
MHKLADLNKRLHPAKYDPRSMRLIGAISALCPAAIGPERRYTYLTDSQHQAIACFLTRYRT